MWHWSHRLHPLNREAIRKIRRTNCRGPLLRQMFGIKTLEVVDFLPGNTLVQRSKKPKRKEMNITSIPMASSFFRVPMLESLLRVELARKMGHQLSQQRHQSSSLWTWPHLNYGSPLFRVGSNFCFQCWMLLCFPVEFGMQIHHVLQSIVKSSVCGVGKKNICSLTAQWHLANAADNGNGYYHWTQECCTHNTILGRIRYLFFIAVQFICVCFPSQLRETHRRTNINLHMFIFTKVDLPINHMIPKWKECIHTHVYENAF